MKKYLLCLSAALVILTSACAQATEPTYLMTREEMLSIYQQSFDRMNTTMEVNLMTLDELPAWEKEYTKNTGRERKEDLIISSLPMEGDIPYEEALRYAKDTVMQTFGVSENRLNAMGVYPLLMDYVYMENESEWEFYFTPIRDTDVMLDHDVTVEGEYRVVFGAQSGNVIGCWRYASNQLSEGELVAIAEAAALEASGMDTEAFANFFAPGYVHHYDQADSSCLVFIYSKTADEPKGDDHVYQVTLNDQTGEIISLEYTNGVG